MKVAGRCKTLFSYHCLCDEVPRSAALCHPAAPPQRLGQSRVKSRTAAAAAPLQYTSQGVTHGSGLRSSSSCRSRFSTAPSGGTASTPRTEPCSEPYRSSRRPPGGRHRHAAGRCGTQNVIHCPCNGEVRQQVQRCAIRQHCLDT
jgi:hypothetical protein